MINQEIRGTVFGSQNPRLQIPHLLRLHHEGQFNVDDLVTHEYTIEEVEKGYKDLKSGANIRGVIKF